MKLIKQLLIFSVLLIVLLVSTTIVVADGCSGLIATGTCVKDERSIIVKNRHLNENNQIPIFGQGTYNYWGIGDGVNSFCRMGLNEKGLAIANFNKPRDELMNGSWEFTSDHSSTSEDNDIQWVLGEYSTVKEAALWLAQHAFFPCQWIIISQNSGVGAVVAMDSNYHSNISWINNTWAAIGNVWYCEQQNSINTQRIEYLINNLLRDQDTIQIEDTVRLLCRDIKASDSNKSEPVGYIGNYSTSGLCPSTSNSGISIISGDDSFDGALSMAWIGIGQTTHLSAFFPLGASYVHTLDDIPDKWTSGNGLEKYVDIKQSYAQESPGVYYRGRVHEIHNYTLPIQEMIFERYNNLMDTVKNSSNSYEVKEKMREYANNTFMVGLQAYIDENPEVSEIVVPQDIVFPDETISLDFNLVIILAIFATISIIAYLCIHLLLR